jgi:Na+-transporting NADH:ubiquinone oxidoreductase subunit NqrF
MELLILDEIVLKEYFQDLEKEFPNFKFIQAVSREQKILLMEAKCTSLTE